MLSVFVSTKVNKNKPIPYFSRQSCVFEVFGKVQRILKIPIVYLHPYSARLQKNINVSDIENTHKRTSANDFHGRTQLRAEYYVSITYHGEKR